MKDPMGMIKGNSLGSIIFLKFCYLQRSHLIGEKELADKFGGDSELQRSL